MPFLQVVSHISWRPIPFCWSRHSEQNARPQWFRIYTHLPILVSEADHSTAGYKVYKGQWLMVPIYAIHRDPGTWGKDAEVFRPSRWLHASAGERISQAKAFMPFGDGPRSCPGAKFAVQEAKLALFRILRQFALELLDPKVV